MYLSLSSIIYSISYYSGGHWYPIMSIVGVYTKSANRNRSFTASSVGFSHAQSSSREAEGAVGTATGGGGAGDACTVLWSCQMDEDDVDASSSSVDSIGSA